jgi:Holliday junction DNA helicase RuvA
VITHVTGTVAQIGEGFVVVDRDGLGYEVLASAATLAELHPRLGSVQTLHTLQYLEGNLAVSHLIPRLIGFLTPSEREFFSEFTKVKGISFRRGLRAMALPVGQLAEAIESGNEGLLTSLPEIGRKTAAQIVAELRGKLTRFLGSPGAPEVAPLMSLTAAQRTALEILVTWGDRRADAQRWISIAVEKEPHLQEADEIVRAAYRAKAG